jgi:hypothetical protein
MAPSKIQESRTIPTSSHFFFRWWRIERIGEKVANATAEELVMIIEGLKEIVGD